MVEVFVNEVVAHADGASASSVKPTAQGRRKAGRATVFRRVTSSVFMVFNWVLALMGFVEGQTVGVQNGLKDEVSD